MKKPKRVVVYGNTLNMAGIATSLKAVVSLEVVCVDPRSASANQSLIDFKPDVIAFDLSDPSAKLDISLLQHHPGLLMIGVDPSSDELLILSSQSTQALSVADLVNVIQQKVAH